MRALPSNSRDLPHRVFKREKNNGDAHQRTPPISFETNHSALVASPQSHILRGWKSKV